MSCPHVLTPSTKSWIRWKPNQRVLRRVRHRFFVRGSRRAWRSDGSPRGLWVYTNQWHGLQEQGQIVIFAARGLGFIEAADAEHPEVGLPLAGGHL